MKIEINFGWLASPHFWLLFVLLSVLIFLLGLVTIVLTGGLGAQFIIDSESKYTDSLGDEYIVYNCTIKNNGWFITLVSDVKSISYSFAMIDGAWVNINNLDHEVNGWVVEELEEYVSQSNIKSTVDSFKPVKE